MTAPIQPTEEFDIWDRMPRLMTCVPIPPGTGVPRGVRVLNGATSGPMALLPIAFVISGAEEGRAAPPEPEPAGPPPAPAPGDPGPGNVIRPTFGKPRT